MYGLLYVCCDLNFFSVLEKIIIILFQQNKPNFKILLKDTYKPYNYGWLVKVSSISDGMLRNFIWSNAIDVDATNAQICEPRTYEMRMIFLNPLDCWKE